MTMPDSLITEATAKRIAEALERIAKHQEETRQASPPPTKTPKRLTIKT
jgi:hypothetical protein